MSAADDEKSTPSLPVNAKIADTARAPRVPLHTKILIGPVASVVAGLLANYLGAVPKSADETAAAVAQDKNANGLDPPTRFKPNASCDPQFSKLRPRLNGKSNQGRIGDAPSGAARGSLVNTAPCTFKSATIAYDQCDQALE